jgi:photosystem II stability/assembly factor-like uncharacterized protein
VILSASLAALVLWQQPQVPSREYAVYMSSDRGVTWVRAGAGLPGNARINTFGAIGAQIFAGTDAGIFASRDRGETWQKTSVAVRTISFATSGTNLYAGTQRAGLLVSKDHGRTWAPVATLASKNIRSLLATAGKLYAGTDADGVLVSSDEGLTWIAQNDGLPPLRQIFAMAVADKDTVFAALYSKGLYAWNEGLRRWSKAGEVKPLVLAAAGAASGSLAVGHNPGGIYSSERPKCPDWEKAIGDFEAEAPVWEMASGGGLLIAGMADGIFRSVDEGRSWSRATRGLPAKGPGVAFLVQGDAVYAGIVLSGGK